MTRLALCGAAAIVVLAGAVTPQSFGAKPREPVQPPPVQISIDARIESSVEVGTKVQIRIPLEGRGEALVQRLRSTPSGYSEEYREALERTYGVGGLLADHQVSQLVGIGRELPRLRIAKGDATLTMHAPFMVLWEEGDDGKELTLDDIDLPPNAHLTVRLHTPGASPEYVQPLPNQDDGDGELRWEFPGGSSPDIEVGLSEPLAKDGGYDVKMPIVAALVSGLPFLVLIGLCRRRRTNGFGPPGALALLALSGVALAAVAAAYFLYQELNMSHFGDTRRMIVALLPAPAIVAFVAVPKTARPIRAFLAGLISVSLATTVAFHLRAEESAFVIDRGLTDAQIVLGGLFGILMLSFIFGTVARWLWESLPEAPKEQLGKFRPWAIGALALASLAAAVQFALAAQGEDNLFGFAAERQGWVAAMEIYLEVLPLQLAGLARSLATTLLGIGISIWLWKRVDDGELPFTSWRECTAVALLFATSVIGLGGDIDGYSVPLAFLFALAGTAVVIRLLAGTARAKRVGQESIKGEAENLLRRSLRLTVIRRQREAANESLSGDEVDHAAYEKQMEQFDRKRVTELDVPALQGVDGEDRAREALALGLGGAEGARSRLETVFRRSGWIVAIPIAYSAYALLDVNLDESLSHPLSPVFLASALFDQMMMWPIAAWAFLLLTPLLPGRIGPLKGLAAGLFCAVPPGLASLLVDDPPGPEQWLFVSAELTLLFVAIGFVLDYRAVRRVSGDLRQLGDLYSITSVRVGLAYLAPLTLLLLSVIQGLASGSGASALGDLVSNAGSLLPPAR